MGTKTIHNPPYPMDEPAGHLQHRISYPVSPRDMRCLFDDPPGFLLPFGAGDLPRLCYRVGMRWGRTVPFYGLLPFFAGSCHFLQALAIFGLPQELLMLCSKETSSCGVWVIPILKMGKLRKAEIKTAQSLYSSTLHRISSSVFQQEQAALSSQ